MPECLPDLPRYVRKTPEGFWLGADHQNGPWRSVPAPQSGLPWRTDGPAVQSREPASVAADASLTPADRLALAVCRANGYPGPCHVSEICDTCRRSAAAVARELAEQVVPEGKVYTETVPDAGVFVSTEPPARFRSKILDLATELEVPRAHD